MSRKLGVIAVSLSVLLLAALFGYFFAPNPTLKTYSLILFLLLVIIDMVFIARTFLSKPAALHRKLEHAESVLQTASLDELKQRYQEMHALYMKLTEHQKQQVYPPLSAFRQAVEELLITRRKLEELLRKAAHGTMVQRRKVFHQAEALFGRLPQQMQETYQAEMLHLKGKLERGVRGK